MRPDIVVRVFHMKLENLLKDLREKAIFGKTVSCIHTIEFQKRGLPHAHILLIVAREYKLRSIDQFDKVVYAELPNEKLNPKLFELVTKHMIHARCGAGSRSACMVKGFCRYGFPKLYQTTTTLSTKKGKPNYKRRHIKDGGFVFKKSETEAITNQWVVGYNPYLLLKYDAHINVEILYKLSSHSIFVQIHLQRFNQINIHSLNE